MKTTNAKTIITNRDNLSKGIKKDWERIKSENSVAEGVIRDYDVMELYESIIKSEAEMVALKLASQAINLGFKSISEMPENTNFSRITALSQLKERKIQLTKIPVKGPNVIMTGKFIKNEIEALDKQILLIEKEIEKFNSEHEFTLAV